MDSISPSKIGYLSSQSQSFLKRSWQKRYYALYRPSNKGIQRLEVFENEESFRKESAPLKIIALNDCIKVSEITQKNQTNLFEIRTKTQCYQFCTESSLELVEWISAIQSAAFNVANKANESFNMNASILSLNKSIEDVPPAIQCDTMEEVENCIYSGILNRESYTVKMVETEASVRCLLEGYYKLVLTETSLSLSSDSDSQSVFSHGQPFSFGWPYRYIRRYGRGKETFSFEAGRKCQSGPGLFTFHTGDNTLTIFQNVGIHMQSLKKMSNESCVADGLVHGSFSQDTVSSFDTISSQSKIDYGTNTKGNKRMAIVKPPRKRNQICQSAPEPMYENTTTLRQNQNVTIPSESLQSPPNERAIDDFIVPEPRPFPEQSAEIPIQSDHLGELYDEPEERIDAWKTLGRGDVTTPPKHAEQAYAILELAVPTDLPSPCSIKETVEEHLYSKLRSVNIHSTPSVVDDSDPESDYSHLKHLMPSTPQSSTGEGNLPKNSTKIDGSQFSATNPFVSESGNLTNRSQSLQNDTCRYENVLMPDVLDPTTVLSQCRRSGRSKSIHTFGAQSNSADTKSEDPTIPTLEIHHGVEHVIRNKVEYAQVIRKSTKI